MNPISMHINTALATGRTHRANTAAQAEAMKNLAGGQQINRAADDPSGLITSENLRAVLTTIDAEVRSLQRADQIANTADGVLGRVADLIDRAEQHILASAENAGMDNAEREAHQIELDAIITSINRVADASEFNRVKLFDGNLALNGNGEAVTLDAVNAANLGEVEADGRRYTLADLSAGQPLNIVTGDLAEAKETVRAARDQVNHLRESIGSFQHHVLAARLNELSVTMENIATAESQVRETDTARESATLSRLNLLQQSTLRNHGIIDSRAKNVLNLLG